MKAVIYQKKQFILSEIEKPIPQANELLVKIHSTSINAADYRMQKLGIIPKSKIFGSDIAGIVEEVGKDVVDFSIGDRICCETADNGFGGLAEYITVPQHIAVKIPSSVPMAEAASVPLASCTAFQALKKGNIEKGQKVLICGAGGGVGTYAVQLAMHLGAEVTAVCGPQNAILMKTLRVKNIIDYNKTDINSWGNDYNLVLGVNGNYKLASYKKLLSPNGICVIVGGSMKQILKTMILSLIISMGNKKIVLLTAKPNSKYLNYIINLVAENKIKPIITKTYSLNDISNAMTYISQGHTQGKIVIDIFSE